jgi:RNA polymerase sigma factor (sigma-70 family)
MSSLPAGDRDFERLYERYDREVYRYALAVLRDPADAEDVTQTTFLNAYRAIQRGERPQKPHNWLITIAHNACRSRLRFAMRRPTEVPLDDVVEQLVVPPEERTNLPELVRALEGLPSNQRAAITMRELEGRSYPEIADSLGVSVSAVEALISRARAALRRQASALRGLVLVQLPRSLRAPFGSGDAAVGAAGAGVAAKAVALVAAGALVGGAGYSAADAGHDGPRSSPVQSLERRVPAAPRSVVTARSRAATELDRRRAAPVHGGAMATAPATESTPTPTSKSEPTAPAAAPAPASVPASVPASTPSAPAAASAQHPVRDAVDQAVAAVTTTATVTVPPPTAQLPPAQVPSLPLPTPTLPTPTVPTLPPPPQIPTISLP